MKFCDMPYERVDFEKTAQQIVDLTEKVKNAKSGEELWEVHQEYYKVSTGARDLMTIAHIRHDVDTTDEFYNQEQEFYDGMRPKLANLLNDYTKAIYETPYRSYMEEKIGKVAYASMENDIKSMDESIIGLMQE